MDERELKSELEAKADTGDIEAIYELGWRSALGIGLPHDEAAGLSWLRQAATRGHMLTQNNLGARYLAGDGVPHDPIEAYRWFTLAAAQGDRKAGKNLDRVAATLTPEQLQQARARVP